MVSEYPEYAEIVQHGYKHVSYHRTGQQKKFEFGFSRSLAEEYNDILSGNLILRKYFGDYLTMAFTAPWEAQSQTTLQALKLVGINILLASPMSLSLLGYSPEVRTILFDIDTSRKIDGFRLQRPPQDIINDINKSTKDLIGIVLHAKELESVDLFYDLASRLKQLEKNGFSFALIKNLFY
ncbi:hypothetical protein Cpin_5658 [Chitinophaga pinensis DSM 2588]|uniref:Polysaccharide deacetylase n=2 Tax=Chitinophaga pinensis TaxID=79329 RepID=A0A979GSH2_CHIPD|nr:hypothetical protein Cpin_5658 [Chitinophaga pinensis DSM 2588]